MNRTVSALVVLAAAAALTACQPAQGGSTTAASGVPANSAPAPIPLGSPPGQPLTQTQAGASQNPFEGDAAAIAQGKALFTAMNCVYCHGAEGSGLMGPPLNGPGWRYGGRPAQIFASIHNGRPQGMPAWGASLPPDQIWKLVAYIESLGGASPPATPQMAQIGGAAPSTTGPEPADQSQDDAAHAGLVAANQAKGG